MSRHRHFRNIQIEDYLDDGDDDDYDYDEEDEEDNYTAYQHQIPEHTIYDAAFVHDSQSASDSNRNKQPDATDEELLDDIVSQFRAVLSDNTLTSGAVDEALREADYDWELALELIRSRRPTEAPCARPSAIGVLLDTDDDPALDSSQQQPKLPPKSSDDSPDYENFVADIGTALTASSSKPVVPFRFDKPSPDDIIRAKQLRGPNRTAPALRLPKPSASHTRGGITVSSENSDSASSVPVSKPKPIKPPPPAKPLPTSRSKSFGQNQAQCQSKGPQKPLKQRTTKVDFSGRLSSDVASIAVIVAGHVDAGKSTLIGHLLQQNATTRKRAGGNLAWVTDDDSVERERGVTIDIASKLLVRPGNPPRTIALIDSPGHRDFVPAMILGAAQAAAALLVVDGSIGEFETGFSEHGQSKEHAIILKAFGVTTIIVVVNKMDVIKYDRKRFESIQQSMRNFLKGIGWKKEAIKYVPVSGRDGVNLSNRPSNGHPLRSWYTGAALLEELDRLQGLSQAEIKSASQQRTRFVVTDFFKSPSLGGQAAVTGRLVAGSIATKDSLVAVPSSVACSVKAVTIGDGDRTTVAISGLDAAPVSLGLIGLPDGAIIPPGCVLCDPTEAPRGAIVVRARVLVTGVDALVLQGTMGILHVAGAAEAVTVVKLCEYVGGKKGGAASKTSKKRPPRRLLKGDSAIVEFEVERAMAMEKADDVKSLGRLAFRQEGRTVAVGIVMEILQTEKEDQELGDSSNDGKEHNDER